MGLLVALFSIAAYFFNTSLNPVTGEKQRVGGMSVDQEIALGLRARGDMAAQFGGLDDDPRARALVERIGSELIQRTQARKGEWRYEFHVLRDREVINAFALPGGQVFITRALLDKLGSEGQVAGVLGHEIGHVIERHGAQHMAKAGLTQGLVGATVIASGDYRSAQLAQMVGALVNLKYGREDELESDHWGLRLMSEAGYDPRSMIKVMEVLQSAGGKNGPEFFSTHPNPENRIQKIKSEIQELYPQGVPAGLKQ